MRLFRPQDKTPRVPHRAGFLLKPVAAAVRKHPLSRVPQTTVKHPSISMSQPEV